MAANRRLFTPEAFAPEALVRPGAEFLDGQRGGGSVPQGDDVVMLALVASIAVSPRPSTVRAGDRARPVPMALGQAHARRPASSASLMCLDTRSNSAVPQRDRIRSSDHAARRCPTTVQVPVDSPSLGQDQLSLPRDSQAVEFAVMIDADLRLTLEESNAGEGPYWLHRRRAKPGGAALGDPRHDGGRREMLAIHEIARKGRLEPMCE